MFALFLENLKNRGLNSPSANQIAEILETTIREIQDLKREMGVSEECYINCVVTNGKAMVGVRYVSDLNEMPSTLYYSEGQRFECSEGVFRMIHDEKRESSVLIVSEKLTGNQRDWKQIPENMFCLVGDDLHVHLRPVASDLAIPRRDPTRQAAGFDASEKGSLHAPQRKGFNPKIIK